MPKFELVERRYPLQWAEIVEVPEEATLEHIRTAIIEMGNWPKVRIGRLSHYVAPSEVIALRESE